MAKCKMIDECPFHGGRLSQYSPSVVESMKRFYCEGGQSLCARYKIITTLGKEHVPMDLSPNDMDQARAIIQEYNEKYLAQKKVTSE